jgi:hypothetical protein
MPLEFGTNGLCYRQIRRVGMVTLYEVSNQAGKLYGYEVAIIRVAKARDAREFAGRRFEAQPAREIYPSNEYFGTYGWYWPEERLSDAKAKFRELVEGPAKPLGGET